MASSIPIMGWMQVCQVKEMQAPKARSSTAQGGGVREADDGTLGEAEQENEP